MPLLLMWAGCSKYDGEFAETYAALYNRIKHEQAFVAQYGEIDADKSWDLTSWAAANRAAEQETRAEGDKPKLVENTHFKTATDWYRVPGNVLVWMKANLIEAHDNRMLGESFMLKLPKNDFAIIPIYQGVSCITSELEMKVNGYDMTRVWVKSHDLRVTDAENPNELADADWKIPGYYDGFANDYVLNGLNSEDAIYTLNEFRDTDEAHRAPSSLINATGIKSKPIYFDVSEINSANDENVAMYMSLHNIHMSMNQGWMSEPGHRLTSINANGYMRAMKVPAENTPALSSLPENPYASDAAGRQPGSEVMIVGCEDADLGGTDNDLNDIVFMIVGYPNLPEIIPTTETIRKRYMCEDLGNNFDFDFNDVVVDVTQTRSLTIKTSEGYNIGSFFDDTQNEHGLEIIAETVEGTLKQTATIAHLCGTLPFAIKVGDVQFPVISDPTNRDRTMDELWGWATPIPTEAPEPVAKKATGWNPNYTREITGWNPWTNNISILVGGFSKDGLNGGDGNWTSSNTFDENQFKGFYDFGYENTRFASFPEDGTVPYIIATDQNVKWMEENQHIPLSWISGKVAQ